MRPPISSPYFVDKFFSLQPRRLFELDCCQSPFIPLLDGPCPFILVMNSDMFLGTGRGPWPSLDAVHFAPQAGQLPALAALAPSHQNPVVGLLQNTAPSFVQHPPVTAALSRKRKAPTLRDSDWEPKKARITQLYIDDNLTIPLLKDALVSEFQFQAT